MFCGLDTLGVWHRSPTRVKAVAALVSYWTAAFPIGQQTNFTHG